MPYYNAANIVTVTKMNMINEMPCGLLRGYLNPNNQYNIYETKYSRVFKPNLLSSSFKRLNLLLS